MESSPLDLGAHRVDHKLISHKQETKRNTQPRTLWFGVCVTLLGSTPMISAA